MRIKVLRLLWSLLLIYYIIELLDFISLDRNNDATLVSSSFLMPRMFCYYDYLIEGFVTKALKYYAVLLSNIFMGGGIFLLFLVPAALLGVPASVLHGILKKIVFWDIIIAIILCLVDAIGCIFLPFAFPCLFSWIMDCFIISLALLSLRADKGTAQNH